MSIKVYYMTYICTFKNITVLVNYNKFLPFISLRRFCSNNLEKQCLIIALTLILAWTVLVFGHSYERERESEREGETSTSLSSVHDLLLTGRNCLLIHNLKDYKL